MFSAQVIPPCRPSLISFHLRQFSQNQSHGFGLSKSYQIQQIAYPELCKLQALINATYTYIMCLLRAQLFDFFVVPYPIVLQIECRFSHMLYVLFVRIFIYYIIYGALQPLVHPFVCTVLKCVCSTNYVNTVQFTHTVWCRFQQITSLCAFYILCVFETNYKACIARSARYRFK